jgi:hypothetical protein
MGTFFSRTRKDTAEIKQVVPQDKVDNEDHGLERLRKTLNQDLETFLLNNILLSVQFFENFER